MADGKVAPRNDSEDYLGPSEVTLDDEQPSTTSKEIQESVITLPEAVQKAPGRKKWDRPIEFLLSCISMSVGLGNIWRFPVTAAKNGGGAFLIPYIIVIIFIGRPFYFMELCLGQFSSCSQIKCWKISPFFKGVGYASCLSTAVVMTYYTSIMGLSVFYFAVSFQEVLPWAKCDNSWAGGTCIGTSSTSSKRTLPDLYFKNYVLHENSDIDDGIGYPDWKLSLALLFSWLLILASHFFGVQSAGKFAYFTAIYPYVGLGVLLVRGLTLKGAGAGLLAFLIPEWGKLADPNVWYEAVTQCFFSLNAGFGSIIMFSSYNKFNQNIYRDAMVVSAMDTFTSLVAGLTIFSVIGYLAGEVKRPVKDMLSDIDGGPGLAFVSYAQAIAKIGWVPQLFSVLFFLMLFTLGLGSSTSDAGAVISVFSDAFPKFSKRIITFIVCGFGFLFGLVFVTPGGQVIFELADYYGGGYIIFITSAVEVFAISWIYGVDNFILDIEFMLKIKLGWYWKLCWKYLIPPLLVMIQMYAIYDSPVLKRAGQHYPIAATLSGFLIVATAIVFLPALAIYSLTEVSGTVSERFKKALNPTEDWGPEDPQIREEWIAFKSGKIKQGISTLDKVIGFIIAVALSKLLLVLLLCKT